MISDYIKPSTLLANIFTIAAGGFGALIGYLFSIPLYALIGPAVFVSLLNIAGFRLDISSLVRDAAFLFLGISIGSGLDASSIVAVTQWPIAFLALGMMLLLIILTGSFLLTRYFGFDRQEAILATSPGHLSFVVSMGIMIKGDATRIMVIQSIRLLVLTLCVPFIATLFGIEIGDNLVPPGEAITFESAIPLILLSILVGYIFVQIKVPAAFVISGMIVSSLGHLTEFTPGVLSAFVVLPSFIVLGCLIGSRFSGITFAQLKTTLLAGFTVTAFTILLAYFSAIPVAILMSMPIAHVILAFAPGGLETMVVMGAVLGADPGFLAACHVIRLIILSFLVPVMVGKQSVRPS